MTAPYAYINTPHANNIYGSASQAEFSCEKEKHVNKLSSTELNFLATEEFKRKLYKLPLKNLELLDSHLSCIFNYGFDNEHRTDMINSLMMTDSLEWKDILNKAKYVIGHPTRGHDIAWATKIFCGVKSAEDRKELANTANGLFDCDDHSRIRVRILAALVLLPLNEIREIKIDYKKGVVFAQKVRDDYQAFYLESSFEKSCEECLKNFITKV